MVNVPGSWLAVGDAVADLATGGDAVSEGVAVAAGAQETAASRISATRVLDMAPVWWHPETRSSHLRAPNSYPVERSVERGR
jgi:hypothetical protein